MNLNLFPDPSLAQKDGLLAIGGNLHPERLLVAYKRGIFPWYTDGAPILWYAPHERFVLNPKDLNVSRSMAKILEKGLFEITFNLAFDKVIEECSSVCRRSQDGTWIVEEMKVAYKNLHKLGFAHSIEVWLDNKLVGGLYGVLVGKVFCGESMFFKKSNASKAALIFLCQKFDLDLIDCQVYSKHLASFGAKNVSSKDFYSLLELQAYEQNGLQKLFLGNTNSN